MIRLLLITLLTLPFIDLYILVEIASSIGFWKTLAMILLTGVIGAEIVRREIGLVMSKLGTSVTLEELSRNSLEALLLLFSGLFLVTPGIVTDIIGVSIAFRPFRSRLVVYISGRLKDSQGFEVQVQEF